MPAPSLALAAGPLRAFAASSGRGCGGAVLALSWPAPDARDPDVAALGAALAAAARARLLDAPAQAVRGKALGLAAGPADGEFVLAVALNNSAVTTVRVVARALLAAMQPARLYTAYAAQVRRVGLRPLRAHFNAAAASAVRALTHSARLTLVGPLDATLGDKLKTDLLEKALRQAAPALAPRAAAGGGQARPQGPAAAAALAGEPLGAAFPAPFGAFLASAFLEAKNAGAAVVGGRVLAARPADARRAARLLASPAAAAFVAKAMADVPALAQRALQAAAVAPSAVAAAL